MLKYFFYFFLFIHFSVFSQTIFMEETNFKQIFRNSFIISAHDLKSSSYKYGGYLFFKSSFDYLQNENKISIKDLICNHKTKSPNSIFMIDHEGGSVNRINSKLIAANKHKTLSSEIYYQHWEEDILYLKSICIDMILSSSIDSDLGSRSFSENLKYNLSIQENINNLIHKNGLLNVIKHFPGKSDQDIICKEKPDAKKEVFICHSKTLSFLNSWEKEKDINLLNQSKTILMVSNDIYPQISNKNSVLDSYFYNFLKNKLNYNGILMSDAIWEIHFPLTEDNMFFLLDNLHYIMILNASYVEPLLNNLWKYYQDKTHPKNLSINSLLEKRIKLNDDIKKLNLMNR